MGARRRLAGRFVADMGEPFTVVGMSKPGYQWVFEEPFAGLLCLAISQPTNPTRSTTPAPSAAQSSPLNVEPDVVASLPLIATTVVDSEVLDVTDALVELGEVDEAGVVGVADPLVGMAPDG
jgi:hypothetical protein